MKNTKGRRFGEHARQSVAGGGGDLRSHMLSPGDNGSVFQMRWNMLLDEYDDKRLPYSLTRDILSFTPKVLHKVIEFERLKELAAHQDEDKDEVARVMSHAVWPTVCSTSCSLMLADVSGFCAISEELCQQGAEGLDELRTGINRCFSALIETVAKYGGDILNFAGDALIIAWFDLSSEEQALCNAIGEAHRTQSIDEDHLSGRKFRLGTLADNNRTMEGGLSDCEAQVQLFITQLNALASTRCGLELAQIEPSFGRSLLRLHVGIASGEMHVFVTGGSQLEYQVLGISPIFKDVGLAVTNAKAKEVYASKQTKDLLDDVVVTEVSPDEDGLTFLVRSIDTENAQRMVQQAAKAVVKLNEPVFRIPLDRNAVCKSLMFLPPPPEVDLISPTPKISVEPEIRQVTVVFLKLEGSRIQDLLENTSAAGLDLVEGIMNVAQHCLQTYEAMLRQFLVDDKGMVMIFALGVPRCVHMDESERGLNFAAQICQGLSSIGVEAYAGVTTGQAYIGSVGNEDRQEYALVGDCVNFAARLMGFGYKTFKLAKTHKLDLASESKNDTDLSRASQGEFSDDGDGKAEKDGQEHRSSEETNSSNAARPSPRPVSMSQKVGSARPSWVIFCDEQTHKQSSQRNFDFEAFTDVKIKGKKDVGAIYRVLQAAEATASADKDKSEVKCFGFEAETAYLRTLFQAKQVKSNFASLAPTMSKSGEPSPVRSASQDQLRSFSMAKDLTESIQVHHGAMKPLRVEENAELKEQETQETRKSSFDSDGGSFDSVPPFLAKAHFQSARRSTRAAIFRKQGGTMVIVKGEEGGGKSTFLNHLVKVSKSYDLLPVIVKLRPTDHYLPYSTLSQLFMKLFSHPEVQKLLGAGFRNEAMREWESLLSGEELKALPEIKDSILQVSSWNIARWSPTETLRTEELETHDLIQQTLHQLFLTPTLKGLLNKVCFFLDDIHLMDSCSWDCILSVVNTPELGVLITATAINMERNRVTSPKKAHMSHRFGEALTLDAVESKVEGKSQEASVGGGSQAAPDLGPNQGRINLQVKQLGKDFRGELHVIVLGCVSQEIICKIVLSAFPAESWSAENLEAIAESAGGFPYVALEVARSIVNDKSGGMQDEMLRSSSKADDTSKGSLRQKNNRAHEAVVKAFMARIDARPQAEQRCLKAASVIGVEFDHATLLEIVPRSFLRIQEGLKVTQLDAILEILLEEEFIKVCSRKLGAEGRPQITYEFAHSKLQQTCYNLLLRADQMLYHKQVAGFIAQKHQDDLRSYNVPLMYHFVKAAEHDKAMNFAIGAIKTSITSGAFSECTVILEEVLHFVHEGKVKKRTARMILNTIKHLWKQHSDFNTAETQTADLKAPQKEDVPNLQSSFAARNARLKEKLPSKRKIIFAENDDDSVYSSYHGSSEPDDTENATEEEVMSPDPTRASKKKFIIGFRREGRNAHAGKHRDAFWKYIVHCIEKLEDHLGVETARRTFVNGEHAKATANTVRDSTTEGSGSQKGPFKKQDSGDSHDTTSTATSKTCVLQ